MSKKAKKYDEGGDIETETTQGQNKSIGDDVRARAMAAMEKGSSEEPTPAPKKAAPKAVVKATPKAEAVETKAEKASPVQQAKDVISGKDVSTPSAKSFSDAGGNKKATVSKADISDLGFKKPSDPLARFEQVGPKRSEAAAPKKKASSDTDYSVGNAMRKGGSVKSSASSRGDGIAQRGRTKGRMV